MTTRTAPAHGPLRLALDGLRTWGAREVTVAVVAGLLVAVLIGVATVLIPNPFFTREIAPPWWNHPVWLLTSALSGMLVATYVDSGRGRAAGGSDPVAGGQSAPGRFGALGGLLAWFAVGCPVCNKLALLALGYSGAITWFAPVQPYLAALAALLLAGALVMRLRGRAACPVAAERGRR